MIEVSANKKYFLGMPVAEFLRDYWQKQPLLIRQAFPDYQAPLSPEDLAGIACEEGVLARLVKHDRKKDLYSLETGPFKESIFPKLGKKDWTLLVQDVDKWDGDVANLLDAFAFLPSWRIDDIMVSYAVDGGSVGAHVDQYDVFLLQAQGSKANILALANAGGDFTNAMKAAKEFGVTKTMKVAGLLVFSCAPGDTLRKGDTVAQIIDPIANTTTPVLAEVNGVMYARTDDRYVLPNDDLANIAGSVPFRTGELLGA